MELYLISHIFVLITCTIFILTTLPLIKGAPFVPTPMKKVKKILKLANIKKGERLYDLGSGDGRFLMLASKLYKAKAVGSEISPVLYLYSKLLAYLKKQDYKVLFKSFRKINLSKTDIVICYLLPERMSELKEKFENELKPGSRIISNAFSIPGWQPSYSKESIHIYKFPECSTKTNKKD